MIVVIDYGMGNLHSVRKALEVVGAKVKVNSHPEDIKKAKKIAVKRDKTNTTIKSANRNE